MISLLPALLLILQAIITVHTELVVVPAVVTDARGGHVSGLTQDNFQIYEDGRLRPTTAFNHGEGSITMGLIVDRSQSMRPKAVALQTVVSALLHASRKDDELFAVDFNDRVSVELPPEHPFTSDAKALEATLLTVRPEGQTALYDGVAEGLRQMQSGHGQRRALVVISDGGDNVSRLKYADILTLARRSDAVIYAIGLLSDSQAIEEEDADLLKRLCRDTGGVAYFPTTAEEIASASKAVADDLREQYTLGFEPADGRDPRAFRKIEVRVTAPAIAGRLRVRTRSGYLGAGTGVKP